MPLLFDDDYIVLKETGLKYEEEEASRFLVIMNFPLLVGLYVHAANPIELVEVLLVIPPNYNTSGGDMFWVHPALKRANGKTIPNVAEDFGRPDARFYKNREYCRWSRHWNKAGAWKPKVDNIQKVLDRIEWALKKPDANK